MKTKLLALLFTVASLNAYSQGKVTLGNDSLHPVVFNPTYMLPADAAYAGQPIPVSPLPSGLNLYIALYGGAGSAALTLQTSYALDAAGMLVPGRFANKLLVLNNVPGGVPAHFQIYFWSGTPGSFSLPSTVVGGSSLQPFVNSFYYGTSDLFTAVPGTSITYPFIYNPNFPTSSTWAPGDVIIYGAAEPSSLALIGLGTGLMLLRRRSPA